MSDERERIATVEVTNAAWTDELQRLISLLEREFYVDAQMADGKMHVIRPSPSTAASGSADDTGEEVPSADEPRDIDELREGLEQSLRDAAEGNTVSVEELLEESGDDTEKEADGDAVDDAADTSTDTTAAAETVWTDDDGGVTAKTPAAIQQAMENPDDLPDEPVPVGVAMQYNAGSYTCDTCDTCLGSDRELTDHVNEEGHRGAYLVNRRGC